MLGKGLVTLSRGKLIGISILLVLALPLVYSAIVVPLSPWEQAQVSLALIIFAVAASLSRAMRPLIIFLSCFASMRYFYWRVSSTINFGSSPDAVTSLLLFLAEVYGLLILFLGYFQTIEVPRRQPAPVNELPSVDVLIPTFNEPVEIVRRTVIGAMALDYPIKSVYVLDDGKRAEIEAMARGLGASYLTRPDNSHAKAGNLNHALARTDGALVAIFDADHVPVRSFLKKTVGFFEDRRVAFVQTAQHFFNPDPFERNLKLAGMIAPEQHFFYHIIQPANDFWNSAFFCGSCAVLRRSALEALGGIRTETVTEDAHTALNLHARGYLSVYLAAPLAAGLATESFAAHVRQRMRWARGMAQILRIDCPLFKRGLSFPQRLNYFNAMAHFFFGIPRLVMIAAPLSFLLFGIHPIKADALAVIAYILPHLGLSTIANSVISKNFRHSFWAAVYEVSIAPYTALATLLALIDPRKGKFNVTGKGMQLEQGRYDFRTGIFTLALLGLSVLSLMIALPARLILFNIHGPNPSELDSIVINSIWAVANLFILISAACVAYEQPQQRKAPRVRRVLPAEILLGEERVPCRTADLSESGVRLEFEESVALPAECEIVITSAFGTQVSLKATRTRWDWGRPGKAEAAFAFGDVDREREEKLVLLMFSGEDSWAAQEYPTDRPLRSFRHLVTSFWRVESPRSLSRRQAPRVRGTWKARYGDVECECICLSAGGAAIRFPLGQSDPASKGMLRIELAPDCQFDLDAVAARPASGPQKPFAVAFNPRSFSEVTSLHEAALATAPAASNQPAPEIPALERLFLRTTRKQ